MNFAFYVPLFNMPLPFIIIQWIGKLGSVFMKSFTFFMLSLSFLMFLFMSFSFLMLLIMLFSVFMGILVFRRQFNRIELL